MTGNARIRRRWRWLSIVAVANLVAVGLVASPSQAFFGTKECIGTVEDRLIFSAVVVPDGFSCALVDSQVFGHVEVGQEANLTLDGSTVWGHLTVREQGFLDSVGSTLRGTVRLRDAFGAVVEGSQVRRELDVRGAGFLIADRSTLRGDVSSRDGQTVVLSSRLAGDLRTDGDLLTDVQDSVIAGDLVVAGAPLGSVVCRSEIDRDARLQDNLDLVQIGPGAFTDCEFNVFGDDVVLRDNLADVQVNRNVIRDDLACTGNEPAPTGADNRVRGEATGQCAGLATAAAPLVAGPSAASPAGSRTAELREQAETRSAAARAAAEAAGPADL